MMHKVKQSLWVTIIAALAIIGASAYAIRIIDRELRG